MKDCYHVFKAAVVPLSVFSRNAFGVGLSAYVASHEGDRCYCSLSLPMSQEPTACRDFRGKLAGEKNAARHTCPSGLSIISVPVRGTNGNPAILISDGFLGEADKLPESLNAEDDIVRLAPERMELLAQYMEQTASLFPMICGGQEAVSPGQGEEDIWQSEAARALIGSSESVQKIRETLPTFANSDEAVLIESEEGNGRHLVASLIHRLATGRTGPFIIENLALLPEIMQERELFGHKGSSSPGLVERAGGGTLFLNGIERLTALSQKNLLQIVAGGRSGRRSAADSGGGVKIIAATSRSVSDLIRKGRFRADLHRRLSRMTLFLPPLRERREDIPLLADHFLQRINSGSGAPPRSFEKGTLQALQAYSWPGNIRELEAEVTRAAAFGGEMISLEDFSPPIQHASRPPKASVTNLREAVGSLEIDMISQTLSETNWNKSQAARILGLSRLGLQKKIDRYGLDRRR
jgi:transcriptional regulator with GAF, ATPase, and Fis domain